MKYKMTEYKYELSILPDNIKTPPQKPSQA